MIGTSAKGIPILLTSSVIAHDKGVRLQNSAERTRLAIESVDNWRRIAPYNPIVLCDGSGFDFSFSIDTKNHGAPIECLSFVNNADNVELYGRGYGEGEILRYALENSMQIQTAGSFAKCTSKLWVSNFVECIRQWDGEILMKGVFNHALSPFRRTGFSYIDTRFYVMKSEIYSRLFLNAHLNLRPKDGYGLEQSFRDIFLGNQMQHCLMNPPPIIDGVGGGTGTYYKNSLVRQYKEKLRYRSAKRDPLFKTWFC